VRGFIDGEYQDGQLRGIAFLGGVRGMGKTTELDRLLASCSGGIVFFDPLSKHDQVFRDYVTVSEPGQLKKYLAVNHGRRFRVMYQPKRGDIDDHFGACAAIVQAFGSMIFGIDEVDMICGPRWGSRRMPPQLYDLVNFGRHHRVSMLATARRPSEVAKGYMSQCHEMRLFRITLEDDQDYLRQYIGRTDAARLSTVPKYQYLLWRDDAEQSQMCGGAR
jgi:hypothetical protein